MDNSGGAIMVHMNTSSKSNNEQLRELVEASGLTQAVALTVFNRGLGVRPYSESAWKAFLADPTAVRFRPLSDDLLAHAVKQFSKIERRS
jgi:hypothetical protein